MVLFVKPCLQNPGLVYRDTITATHKLTICMIYGILMLRIIIQASKDCNPNDSDRSNHMIDVNHVMTNASIIKLVQIQKESDF